MEGENKGAPACYHHRASGMRCKRDKARVDFREIPTLYTSLMETQTHTYTLKMCGSMATLPTQIPLPAKGCNGKRAKEDAYVSNLHLIGASAVA